MNNDIHCICTCACGNTLTLTVPEIYGTNHRVHCNKCLKEILSSRVMYHCSELHIQFHPHGYDLCNSCHYQLISHSFQLSMLQNNPSFYPRTSAERSKHCYSSIENCEHVQLIVHILTQYHQYHQYDTYEYMLPYINISDTLTDYIHLLQTHDIDNEFKYIVDQIKFCDIKLCNGYLRNNRYRNNLTKNKVSNVSLEILDKIHCYFMHNYDIGARLT
eukprot:498630_1